MTKSLKDLPKFYAFTDVYGCEGDIDVIQATERETLFYYLNKSVEQGVNHITLSQKISPYKDFNAEVKVYKDGELAELESHTYKALQDFAWYAALTYYPNIKADAGGEWWCAIEIDTEPLKVSVRYYLFKFTLRHEAIDSVYFVED